jgi:peptidoglycan/LPS O-acetylase OafA/YrhL
MSKNVYLIPEYLDKPKLPSLDGLRALSIIFVIIHHIYFYEKFWTNDIDLGRIGVHIFFVISGFLITTLLIKEKISNGNINLKSFYIRRAFRILPVLFLFLFTLMLLNKLFSLEISGLSFFTSFFFLGNLGIDTNETWYTGHFWSLAIEEQFYLIFPFLLYKLDIKKYRNVLILLILIIPVLNSLYWSNSPFFHSSKAIKQVAFIVATLFSQGTLAILAGSLCSIFAFSYQDIIKKMLQIKWLGIFMFLIALLVRFKFPESSFILLVFDFLIGIVIIVNLNKESFFTVVLDNFIMVRIGILSYSLYVWQQIFTNNQPWMSSFNSAGNIFLNLFFLFVVGYISYEYFEKRFISMRKRFL